MVSDVCSPVQFGKEKCYYILHEPVLPVTSSPWCHDYQKQDHCDTVMSWSYRGANANWARQYCLRHQPGWHIYITYSLGSVRVRSYLPFPSAVKGMVRPTESELAVLFGIQGVPSEWAGLGAATACVCPPPSTTRERKIEFFKITIGPQEVRWY